MLFPAQLASHTVESLLAEHAATGRGIYWTLLGALAGAAALALGVSVDVSVRARGIVRAAAERIELRTDVAGRVAEVLVAENESVTAGQVLLRLDSADLRERLAHNRAQQAESAAAADDWRTLLGHGDPATAPTPQTPLGSRELAQFAAMRAADALTRRRAEAEWERCAALASRGLVSAQEAERCRYEAERSAADAQARTDQALARWQALAREESLRLAQLTAEERHLQEELKRLEICAPADGVVLGWGGLGPGTAVAAGQAMGALSPEDDLVAEAFVSPADVALIRVGQAVRLQLDAFPAATWGPLGGEVTTVSDDWVAGASRPNPGPYFRVTVEPAAEEWLARHGPRAALRKGLTLTARFVVARRTLWQLLHEEARGWLEAPAASAKRAAMQFPGNSAGGKPTIT